MKKMMLTAVSTVFLGSLVCAWEVEFKPGNAYDFETITITSSTASGLTTSKLAPTTSRSPRRAVITVDTTDLRYRVDGSTPTQTVGHLVDISLDNRLVVEGEENMKRLSMVGVAASSTVQVTYER